MAGHEAHPGNKKPHGQLSGEGGCRRGCLFLAHLLAGAFQTRMCFLLLADAVISPYQDWELVYFLGSHLSSCLLQQQAPDRLLCVLFLTAHIMGHGITWGGVESKLERWQEVLARMQPRRQQRGDSSQRSCTLSPVPPHCPVPHPLALWAHCERPAPQAMRKASAGRRDLVSMFFLGESSGGRIPCPR